MRLHMISEADEPMMGSSHLMAVQIFCTALHRRLHIMQ
jgi:hypothetical protein